MAKAWANACRFLLPGLASGLALAAWLAAGPVGAEIIVAPADPVGIPLVIHGSPPGGPSAAPPVVVYVPQGPLYGPLPGGDAVNSGTLRSNQSNIGHMLWRSDRLRGDTSGYGQQTIIMLSR